MKRILASLLLLGTIFSCFTLTSAVEIEPFRASLTLSRYSADLFSGSSKGKVTVSYDVRASKPASSVGVESISFYTEDGNFVASVSGTTSNGLVCTDTMLHGGDYEYSLPSGEYYYAKVTVFAIADGAYDSRTVTTSTVWVR